MRYRMRGWDRRRVPICLELTMACFSCGRSGHGVNRCPLVAGMVGGPPGWIVLSHLAEESTRTVSIGKRQLIRVGGGGGGGGGEPVKTRIVSEPGLSLITAGVANSREETGRMRPAHQQGQSRKGLGRPAVLRNEFDGGGGWGM